MTGEEEEMIMFYTPAWLHSFNTYESHEIPYLYDLANESCLHHMNLGLLEESKLQALSKPTMS